MSKKYVDRGIMKWAPFDSVMDSEAMVVDVIDDKKKQQQEQDEIDEANLNYEIESM